MSLRNRTVEFQRSVATQVRVNKLSTGSNGYKPLDGSSSGSSNVPVMNKSEFSLKASGIAHEIASTAQLLGKLATLCKKKPMINDNPVEIAELSFVIKRKIYAIEQEMMKLKQNSSQQAQTGAASAPKQGEMKQHNNNVMNLLSTKMKNISGNFKTVLEQRQKMEIANKDRLMKLTNSQGAPAAGAHLQATDGESNNGYNTHTGGATGLELENSVYNNSNPFLSSAVTVNGEYDSNGNSNYKQSGQLNVPSEQQMMLLEQEGATNQAYMQERNRAVETIESTIQEVGSLFQQLAHMVQEQGEQIQRIDENVQDIDLNIEGAQAELMKYFDRISNNRWMAAKIFAVLFAFFLIWVLVN
ncbi:hypothetical protein ACO0RG_001806 [Hanseniaspora osmophila]